MTPQTVEATIHEPSGAQFRVLLVLLLALSPRIAAAVPGPAADPRLSVEAAARETSVVVLARLVNMTPVGVAPAISTDNEFETVARLAEVPGAAAVDRFSLRTFGGRAADKIISYGGQPELAQGQSYVVLLHPGPAGTWIPAGSPGASVFPVVAGPTGVSEVRLLDGRGVVIANGKLELEDRRSAGSVVRPGATPDELARWALASRSTPVAPPATVKVLRVSGVDPTVAGRWLEASAPDLARCGRDAVARGAPSPLLLRCSVERRGSQAALRVSCVPADEATGFAACSRAGLARRELPGSGPVLLELELTGP